MVFRKESKKNNLSQLNCFDEGRIEACIHAAMSSMTT